MYRIQITCALLILWSATSLLGGQVLVTNTDDSGPGSLREALLEAQTPKCPKPCKVVFNMVHANSGSHVGFYWTIAPSRPLPVITVDGIEIDGETQRTFRGDTNPAGPEVVIDGSLSLSPDPALTFRRPASAPWIGGFAGLGGIVSGLGFTNWSSGAILVEGSSPLYPIHDVRITSNYIGVEADGVTPAPNLFGVSVLFAAGISVAGNVISANAEGVRASDVAHLLVGSNTIGMDARRQTVLGNGDYGVSLRDADTSWVKGNHIAGHAMAAIGLTSNSRRGWFSDNTMIDNGLGIDLAMDGPTTNDFADYDSGPNELQNSPELSVQGNVLTGSLDSTPNTDFAIEICATRNVSTYECQAYIKVIYVRTDSFGHARFSYSPIPAKGYITAAASAVHGPTYSPFTEFTYGDSFTTSEFSTPVQ